MADKPFWESKSLEAMSDQEWESLCDGCAKCCLQKLEDSDTGQVYFTSIACRLLDRSTCRCSDYSGRQEKVPDCTMVRPLTREKCSWLPSTCAYRLIANGESLPDWHPLVSGDPESIHDAGLSVKFWAVPESDVAVDEYQEYVINLEEDCIAPE